MGRITLAIAVLVAFGTATGHAQTRREIEYRLKAVYLFNFLQFTEWPDSAFENASSPIILGVLGKDPFGQALDEVVQAEKIGEHPITVVRFQTMDQLTNCHVIFFCLSEKGTAQALLYRLKGFPTLTVSEIDGFGSMGGCVRFYVESNKLRFEVSMEALNLAGLKMSSKLLRLAKIINPM